MAKDETPISLQSWAVLLLLSVIWGSSFILIKKALIALTPVQLACIRITLSSLAFTPFFFSNLRKVDWSRWHKFLIVGLTGSGIPAFMYAIAQTQISSSLSGIFNSMTPIFTLVIGVLFFGAGKSWLKTLGVLLGFMGVYALFHYSQGSEGGDLRYAWLLLVGTLCYGTSVNVVKTFFQDTRPWIISAVSFFMIGPPAMVYLLTSGAIPEIMSQPDVALSLGAALILSLVGTVLATIVFYKLVQDTNAVFGSSVAYIMPVVALLWGFLDGEILQLGHLLGMVLILTGVFLIKKAK